MAALPLNSSGAAATPRAPWRINLRPGRAALLPADKLEFTALCDALARVVRGVNEIEAEVRRGAALRSADAHARQLWTDALLAGREPELTALRQDGERTLAALQSFAESCGFRSAEQLARACGLPSPSGLLRAA